MCDYCDKDNTEEGLSGDDGIVHRKDNTHYLYAEHFYKEICRIDVNYCPKCGVKLGFNLCP